MRVKALQNDMTLIENDMTFLSMHSLQMLLEDPTLILRLTDMLQLGPAPERVPQRRRKYHIHGLTDTAARQDGTDLGEASDSQRLCRAVSWAARNEGRESGIAVTIHGTRSGRSSIGL
jgi:hypothetical protein